MSGAKMTICNGQVTVELLARELGYYEMRVVCDGAGSSSFSMTPSELHGLLKLIGRVQKAMMELKAGSGGALSALKTKGGVWNGKEGT